MAEKRRNLILSLICPICGGKHSVEVNAGDFMKYEKGELAQNCFPYLNAEEREQIISRFCPACQKKVFGEE